MQSSRRSLATIFLGPLLLIWAVASGCSVVKNYHILDNKTP